MDIDDPLPPPVLRLARIIEDICGFCTLTGSAALAKYLRELPAIERVPESPIARVCGFKSNDVDLFVPMYPKAIEEYQRTGIKNARHREFFGPFYLEEIFQELQKYGFGHTNVEKTEINLTGVEQDTSETYRLFVILTGLVEKIEFRLVAPDGQVIDRPIQILVMEAFPETPEQSWNTFVVNGFDIDIVKGWAQIDKDANLDRIVYSNEALQSIQSGSFRYSVRNCVAFPDILQRMSKYSQRGFELASFGFNPRVPDEWMNHILLQFHRMYARHWIQEWEDSNGLTLFQEVVKEHIMSFLECRTEEEITIQNRLILRNAVRSEIERRNGFDLGQNRLSIERLEREWQIIDAGEEGEEH